MKRCPKCSTDYFDNMLEFCLDDGARLVEVPYSAVATEAIKRPAVETHGAGPLAPAASQETVVLQPPGGPTSAPGLGAGSVQSSKVLETVPIVFALAHNWWQWLYLEKTYVYSVADFLLSANFLMWVLLLGAGTASGIYAVKSSKDKTIAIVSLVALAVNLILFLVPRK